MLSGGGSLTVVCCCVFGNQLDRILSMLQSPLFGVTVSLECIFYKALFLVALAIGLRASQLHALTCTPSLT